ncbi:MAG: GumC family protein, partial [Anaerolineales bacterium]
MAYEIAIPEDDSKTLTDYLDALKRRRGTATKLATAVLIAGLVIIFMWPNTYRSMATILIEDPDIPPGLVPTTVTTFAARQIQYINQRVMTRTNLAQIIEKFNLYADERKYLPTLLLVPDVQKDVKIDIIDAPMDDQATQRRMNTTIAFQVGFEHQDPNVARQVANELVSLYLAENVRSRTEQTAQTSQFMQAEVDRQDGEVRDIESQIAKIKQQYEGSLPEQSALNMQFIERSDQQMLDIERQIKGTQETKVLLDAQLSQLEPMEQMILPDGRGVASPADQLRALQSQLAVLEGRYSPDHPDVLRTRRDVEALKAEVGGDLDFADTSATLSDARSELAKARERYTADHPEVMRLERQVKNLEEKQAAGGNAGSRQTGVRKSTLEPNNPAYIQVEAQRKSLDLSEAALNKQKIDLRAKIADYERKIDQSSDVERQLSALQRKLNTAYTSYQAARDRLFAAQMGQSMETQSKGERFSLVEPPDLPLLP